MRTIEDELPSPDIEGVDQLSYRVFQTFVRTLHLHRQLVLRILSQEGAHPGQTACLRVLGRHDGLSQRELAEVLLLSRPTVTAMLQRMEKSEVVARRPDANDQRITRVFLTPDGRRLERDLRSIMASYTGRIFEGMSEQDRRELDRLLGIMAENITRALA